MTIRTAFEDARNGELDRKRLDGHIRNSPDIINKQDPTSGRTLLAIAAVGGFPEEIETLFRRNAKAYGLSRSGETPLLLATWKATRERPRIIQLLLKKTPADLIDATCSIAAKKTPLMYAIEHKDIESIRLLRRAGASLDIQNEEGFNAKEMAEKMNDKEVLRALEPEKEKWDLSKLADITLSFLLYTVSWVNTFLDEVIRWTFGLDPELDPGIDERVNDAEEVNEAEFLRNVDDFVTENPTLERFFKDDKKFIQDLARKAVDLKDDPDTDLGKADLLPKTIKVSLHQQVIYCDDSSSMKHEDRWDSQKHLVNRIAKITTRVLPEGEGVALRFINQDVGDSSNLSLQGVGDMIEPMSWKPGGGTPIGTNLRAKILEPLVYQKVRNKSFKRPLLISITTDGIPSTERGSAFVDAISECGEKLEEAEYPRENVKFMVGQIGTSSKATNFLESLRDNVDIAPVVFVTSERLDEKLRTFHDNDRDLERWLIQTLFSSIKEATA
ncbi:ankyrin [Daldinia bambusicola]|nr:ankyrin [Daldinia bambusicola]